MLRKDVILIIKSLLKEDKKRRLHISLSTKRFYNGIIIDYKNKDTLSFDDDMLGEYPILYSLIINVEPVRVKK